MVKKQNNPILPKRGFRNPAWKGGFGAGAAVGATAGAAALIAASKAINKAAIKKKSACSEEQALVDLLVELIIHQYKIFHHLTHRSESSEEDIIEEEELFDDEEAI